LDLGSLLRRAQSGDREAFSQFVEKTQERLYRVIYANTRNHDDTQDLVQETFLHAYQGLPRYREESQPFTWLCGIGLNLARQFLRRRKIRKWLSLDIEMLTSSPAVLEKSPEQILSDRESREILQRAIADLPHAQRTALILHDVEGLPHAQIAQILECPEGTVHSHLHRARKRLRKMLGDRA
jgi:RNA polymerase sigma-70 factor (ECF subfamily)